MPQMRVSDGKEIAARGRTRFTRKTLNGSHLNESDSKWIRGMMPYLFDKKLFEHRLIGDIVREYPKTSQVMEEHFGEGCLERRGFKIQTLGMACILFGVDRKKLLKELGDFQN